MPELPDIVAYVEAIQRFALNQKLERVRIFRPFLVRSLDPPVEVAVGRRLIGVSRLGKRIVLEFEGDLKYVIHLMIAGRLLWNQKPLLRPSKTDLAEFGFEQGNLLLTEAGSKRRASLHCVSGKEGLGLLDRGGTEPLTCSLDEFSNTLLSENRTLKRMLTSPHKFSGIGNAYSDEILFEAGLSPVRLTQSLKSSEIERLWRATQSVLEHWIEVLRADFKGKFPGRGQVTAFRDDFNVHGRFGKPCRRCGAPIQRIVHAENETNYCARCQNEGRLLADRALSRLLKEDWPRTLDELIAE